MLHGSVGSDHCQVPNDQCLAPVPDPYECYLSTMRWYVLFLTIVLSGCNHDRNGQVHSGVIIREVWIPMADGTKLAADLYQAEGSSANDQLPVLLEYLPYRKDEGRRNRFGLYEYFVKRGYIVARVDIRGTGRSEGTLIPYEYSEIEQQDGDAVIDWLSKQDFSNGNIGMFGISWGGFNAIHMAMRRPPALKTIITLMSTDDIYQDDVHFMDGMMHVDAYEIGQDLSNILPGAPDYVLDEKYFTERFETTPWLLQYKKQQRDGKFWDRASLNSDYGRINIPVFAIGGWYDGYRDAVFRMMEHLRSPTKVLIGPWNHTFPNWADPPPAVEWRADAVRWLDQWLKGKDTGILDEPSLTAFVRDYHPPGSGLKQIDGFWYSGQGWPLTNAAVQKYFFTPGNHLSPEVGGESSKVKMKYVPSAGVEVGGSVMWWGDWSPDQRLGDSTSLVFETEPLTEDVTILGFPQAHLIVSADANRADWFVRLSDVSPEGPVTLVTGAGANGTHRSSSVEPSAIRPGEEFSLDIELHATSWIFRKGHRIRIAVSNALWPMIWPTPKLFTSSLSIGGSAGSWVTLPLLNRADSKPPVFSLPENAPRFPGYEPIESGSNSGFAEVSGVTRDSGGVTVKMTNEDGYQFPWGKMFGTEEITHHVADVDPAHTSVTSHYSTRIEIAARTLLFEGVLTFTSDETNFYYAYTRSVTENNKLIRTKTWKETIPRDFQ